ncbi:hypothetical protein [Noviherbaspirillum denitrificans]|uniref:Uncharacterized protein n=1 Tax=Noviherbaspirillum denitrificans TaxID=1968433 RepID=A0A254TFL5_9BURK|nr:hypothetical protein [Noviherbaspirillum denitrificans]OWW18458.1 hypothetical protein AYR66_00445 [Noviherbaspirillum denitrificans]
MIINWRDVSGLLSLKQTLLFELGRTEAVLAELERRQNQLVSPDITVNDLQDIFEEERARLLTKIDQVASGLRHWQGAVAGDLVQHNRFIELLRRSVILNPGG